VVNLSNKVKISDLVKGGMSLVDVGQLWEKHLHCSTDLYESRAIVIFLNMYFKFLIGEFLVTFFFSFQILIYVIPPFMIYDLSKSRSCD
jgi:hypothetical protein